MENWDRVVRVEFKSWQDSSSFTVQDLKIEFDIDKTSNVEPNKCFLKIYNMNPDHRGKMRFRWNLANDKYGGEIKVLAGYGSEYKQIFRGSITQATNKKVGPEWVTEVEAQTMLREMLRARINRPEYPAGTAKINIFNDILNDLGIPMTARSKSKIREKFGSAKIKKSWTLYGSAADCLDRLSNNLPDFINIKFHDDGVDALRVGESINDTPIKIWPDRGLIGTPDVTIKGLDCKCMLRHDVHVGVLINVKSKTVASLEQTGNYVIRKVQHKGSNRDGEFVSMLSCVYPLSESNVRSMQ